MAIKIDRMTDGREWQLLSVEYRLKDREIIQDSRELFSRTYLEFKLMYILSLLFD